MELNDLIKSQLLRIVDDLDNGSEIDSEHANEVLDLLASVSDRNYKMSKYQACSYLGKSRAAFDNLVAEGKLPKGRKQAGFKELF